MKKRRILIASILKPVDDTRMFEKMAVTLAGSGRYEVFIAGFPSARKDSGHPDIHFMPLNSFTRISFGRLIAPVRIQKIIHQVKPDILLVNTHELLLVGLINRIFFGVRFVYDVRENYFRNILHTNAFPLMLRPLLAGWVRLKEKATALFVHRFLLAEKGYEKEMHFFGGRSTVIENKVLLTSPLPRSPEPGKTRLLFSGTLAESTGVFEAIRLAIKLHEQDPKIILKIIGYAAQPAARHWIREAVAGKDFIEVTGLDSLVQHPEILKAIANADFGIICYPTSPHSQNAIPTKLYEYLAGRLPILMSHHPVWEEICKPSAASLTIDFHNDPAAQILERMKSAFYLSEPANITWETEGVRLLTTLDSI